MRMFPKSDKASTRTAGLWALMFYVFATLAAPALAHEGHRENQLPQNEIEADATVMTNALEAAGNQTSAVRSPEGADAETGFDAVDFLGRLHPAAAHFPVALLLTAAFAELLLAIRPGLGLAPTVRFLVYIGAAGALGTAFLGWFAGGFRFTDRDPILGLHRWNGTTITAVALATAVVAARTQVRRTLLRLLLGVLSIAIVVQGFLGGELTFGPNHLGV